MKDLTIQYFESVFAKDSTPITLKRFATAVQDPKPNIIEAIKRIREVDPENKKDYDKEKAKLPAFLFNVRTDGRGTNGAVRSINPILYLDIDRIVTMQVDQVKALVMHEFPSLLMIWRSAGGRGLGMLMHLGPHAGHFEELRAHFSSFCFAGYKFDPKCFTAVRKNYLSHDPQVYINWDAPEYNLPEDVRSGVLSRTTTGKSAPLLKISNNRVGCVRTTQVHSRANCTVPYVKPEKPWKIRYSNRSSFAKSDGSTHTVHQEGFLFTEELWLTTRNQRTLTLLKAARKLLVINPQLRAAPCQLTYHLNVYNEMRLAIPGEGIPPLPIETVHKTALQALNTDRDIGNQMKKGYIAWPEGSKLTPKEKMVIAGREGAKLKRQRTLKDLQRMIDQHSDPSSLTRKEMASLVGKSVRTVKSYAREIDQFIQNKSDSGAL